MLSRKAKYALKALLALAAAPQGSPILIADLAEREAIPKKFLELILLDLKRQGLLASKKGRGGGYVLARPPAEITFGRVIRILDGPLAPVSCASQTAYRTCEECIDEDHCGVKLVMIGVRDAMSEILDRTTLSDVSMALEASRKRRRGRAVRAAAAPG